MKNSLALLTMIAALAGVASAASGQRIILFEDNNYRGERLVVDNAISDLGSMRFNDKASSLKVESGEWEVCQDDRYRGCRRLDRTQINDLGDYGLNDRISSLRPISGGGSVPPVVETMPAISGGSDGHGVVLGSDKPAMLRHAQANLAANGTFSISTNGDASPTISGTWSQAAGGGADLSVTSYGGAPASGSGFVSVASGRVDNLVASGSSNGTGWRVSFTAGRGVRPAISGMQVTCESNGGFTFCPVDTAGAVEIERRLDGSNCTYNRTWSWTHDGIWVDNGCRAEFRIGKGAAAPGRPAVRRNG